MRPPSPTELVTGAEERATVWLVDDSPLEAMLGQRGLGMIGVTLFHDGSTMLERLALTKELPDIIVLDWHMPDISGLDVCRAVRGRFDSAQLPILILTASGDHQTLVEGFGAGANDFLRKPFHAAELNARVTALVRTRRLHQKLTRLETALRDEAAFREQFLAILAHDLRQPLNVFALGTDAIAAADTPPDVRAKVAVSARRASERMERMIVELLDFSRARLSGGMPIRPREARFDLITSEVVDQIRLAQPSREILFSAEGDCRGFWDADRLAQVVSNLVENAVANSPPDTRVGVRLQADHATIALKVENQGPVIPPERIATIFDPFRERRPNARGGLGLGLFIVAQIVRAHGGTAAVTSADGRTTFDVLLPRAPPSVLGAAPG